METTRHPGRLLERILRGLGALILACMIFVAAWLSFMFVALGTLEDRYTGLRAGLTVEETDVFMGGLFQVQTKTWDDIPTIYTAGYTEKPGGTVREYQFLGLDFLNIVVLYDGKQRSWLHIPCYE